MVQLLVGEPMSLSRAMAGLLVVISTAACTASPEEAPQDEPSATSPSPSASPDPGEAVLDAYEGLWGVIVNASRTTDPDFSELDNYAEGQAAELAQHGLGAEAEEGVVARGAPSHDPEVTSLEETSAEIEDCMDSSEWLREDAETGELIEESPSEPLLRKVEATAGFDGLVWRISEMRIYEQGSC